MFKIYENVDFKKYSPLTVILLTLTLCVLQKDLAFTQEYSLGYKLFQAYTGRDKKYFT